MAERDGIDQLNEQADDLFKKAYSELESVIASFSDQQTKDSELRQARVDLGIHLSRVMEHCGRLEHIAGQLDSALRNTERALRALEESSLGKLGGRMEEVSEGLGTMLLKFRSDSEDVRSRIQDLTTGVTALRDGQTEFLPSVDLLAKLRSETGEVGAELRASVTRLIGELDKLVGLIRELGDGQAAILPAIELIHRQSKSEIEAIRHSVSKTSGDLEQLSGRLEAIASKQNTQSKRIDIILGLIVVGIAFFVSYLFASC